MNTSIKPSPEIGATILASLHGNNSGLTEIVTTGPVQWNDNLQRYYVNGHKRMKSNGRLSRNELRFCLVDFEVFNLGQVFQVGHEYSK